MEFGGRYRVSAPRAQVWAALNDTEKLKTAIPGCRRLEWTGPGELALEVEVGLGVARMSFSGDLSLHDVAPAQAYTLSGRGHGMLGRAEGAAKIALSDLGEDTELRFTAVGGADGALMKLGQTLLGRTAQKVIDHFFARFGETFGAEVTSLGSPADAPPEGVP